YREACARLGETDREAQERLAFYLHRLGIALNYKDDPRLQDTHVLNPHWVTSGIYKIINAEQLERQKGEIGLRDLPAILDPEVYPPHMHRFLFDLMKKFELCFSFPEDDCQYLIPQLLDKQQPAEADEFAADECLNFQYHYPVLPEGLLPRFIVRTHALSEGLPRWRSGVILRFQGNRALVKGDTQDKKVFINVAGPVSSRRRLLAVVRSEFERIHHDIRNLQPREMVPVPGRPSLIVSYQDLEVRERHGDRKFTAVTDGQVVELDVQDLLNGVDLEGARGSRRMGEAERGGGVRIFYSYSRKDEWLRNELETHLTPLRYQGLIESWYDGDIEAGREWDREIGENLERAQVILLLVSADYVSSSYVWEKEIKRAMERHDRGEAAVIPIILRDVNWQAAQFARLQALPENGLPVTRWPDKDSAWRGVSEEIEKVVRRIVQETRRA
ncbi:MAG TPA: COR domain-containing protein, partial [Pyrinomonadaceae bacterium]|nr:COR domain-containing protein [Pyrinomonadaceae bacterium]